MNQYYWFLIAFLVIGAICFCYCLCGHEKRDHPRNAETWPVTTADLDDLETALNGLRRENI